MDFYPQNSSISALGDSGFGKMQNTRWFFCYCLINHIMLPRIL